MQANGALPALGHQEGHSQADLAQAEELPAHARSAQLRWQK